jgi:hypothetical protein
MSMELKYKIEERKYADIVLGKDTSIPRGVAIRMLTSAQLPDTVELLAKIIENPQDKPKYKRLAVNVLWRMNDPKAESYLHKTAEIVDDPDVLTAVVKFLGRIGDQNALKSIEKIEKKAKGILKDQSLFAEALISYRLGLDGHEIVDPKEYIHPMSAVVLPMKFIKPQKSETDMFAAQMNSEPYGINFSLDKLLQFSCPAGQLMFALNKDFADKEPINNLQQRKNFMGVIATKEEENMRYVVSYLVLTTPQQGGKVSILVTRSTGETVWAGGVTKITSLKADFFIKTVGKTGVAIMEAEGTLNAKGQLDFTRAVSTTNVMETRHPQPLSL